MEKRYDIIIVGCGPAGMTAGIYAQRAGMKCLGIEKMMMGGQVALTPKIENYPGYLSVNGAELSEKMFQQAKSLGMEFEFAEVQNIETQGKIKRVKIGNVTYTAPAVILSMGASSRSLGVEDAKYIGKGVSYCAVCDGAFFTGKKVAVVGGGNSALEDIEYLSDFVSKIIHIHRRNEFRADDVNVQAYNKLLKANDNNKIEAYLGYVVDKLNGKDKLESIEIKNVHNDARKNIEVDGLFVAIGRVPQTEIVDKKLKLSENGYIEVNDKMETNIEGVFACGDIVSKTLRQICTATSDGAIAGMNASIYVKKSK